MCGGETVAKSSAPVAGSKTQARPRWLKVHGRVVDVEKFRHPGGNIIEFFYGMDGTSAFEQVSSLDRGWVGSRPSLGMFRACACLS
jgi:cytochrome b involved in lipid metabolism